MSDTVDCPKCNGTGKVPKRTSMHGLHQHIFDTGWSPSVGRGPSGHGIWVCRRCKVERSYDSGRAIYRVAGEPWKCGPFGCIKPGTRAP